MQVKLRIELFKIFILEFSLSSGNSRKDDTDVKEVINIASTSK